MAIQPGGKGVGWAMGQGKKILGEGSSSPNYWFIYLGQFLDHSWFMESLGGPEMANRVLKILLVLKSKLTLSMVNVSAGGGYHF